MDTQQLRRRLRRVGLTAAVVVLGVGVWQGVAGATATGGKAVKIEHHNGNCGRTVGTPSIGTATFSRSGNTVSVKVDLVSADEDTNFEIILFIVKSGGGCKNVADMGSLTTDSGGRAHGEFSAQVDPKSSNFFMDAFDGLFANDSLIVKLKA